MTNLNAQLDTQKKILHKEALFRTFCDDRCSIYALFNTIATSHVMTIEHLKCG